MNTEINTDKHYSRVNFKIYTCLLELLGIERSEHLISEASLISKVRNYSSTEYEIMASFLDKDKSIINELSKDDRHNFFHLFLKLKLLLSNYQSYKLQLG